MNFHSFLPSLIHSLIVVTGWEMKRGIPMKMVAVSSVSRKKTSRKREKPFFFFIFLSCWCCVISFLLSYPTQLKFPADVLFTAATASCALPFFFLPCIHTKIFLFFFFLFSIPPRASSVSRSAPSRTTKPRENTHAGSVVQKTSLSRRNFKRSQSTSAQTIFLLSQYDLYYFFPLFLKEAKYIPSPQYILEETGIESFQAVKFLLSLFNLAAKS